MKIVVADSMGQYVDTVYAEPRSHGAIDLFLATVYFSFQVYGDFAGYSLIAIGSARLLGIELLPNFQQPYLSQSLPEYWRRWHVSLSSWFRDYVFVPLQFSLRRTGKIGLALALVFTFTLVGAWHGAGAKYAIFGLIHGVLVAYSTLTIARRDRVWKQLGMPLLVLRIARALTTFIVITLTFVLFRANDLTDAVKIYETLLSGSMGERTLPVRWPAVGIACLIVCDLIAVSGWRYDRLHLISRWAIYYATTGVVCLFALKHLMETSPYAQQFIYFNF